MAEIVFNWKDDDLTRWLNQRLLGIIEAGLYRGYHANLLAGLELHLVQTQGVTIVSSPTESDPVPYTPVEIKQGVVLTKQGVAIREADEIILPIQPGDSTNPRIDIIVLETAYVIVQNGASVSYSVVEGTPSPTPVAPVPVNPLISTVLGYLYVPAGMTSLTDTGVEYTRAAVPDFANSGQIVYRDQDQTIEERKRFWSLYYKIPASELETCTVATGVLTLPNRRNFYFYLPAPTTSLYVPVTSIAQNYGDGHSFRIFSGQRLAITPGSGIITADNSVIYIEENETFEVMNLGTNYGGIALVLITKGNDFAKGSRVKFKNTVRFKKSSFSPALAGSSPAVVDLATHDGNFISATMASGVSYLSAFGSLYDGYGVIGGAANEAGMELSVYVSTANTLNVEHNIGGLSGNQKPIWVPGEDTLQLTGPLVLTFVEDATHFRLKSWASADQNLAGAFTELAAHDADISTLQSDVTGLQNAVKPFLLDYYVDTVNANTTATQTLKTRAIPANFFTQLGDYFEVDAYFEMDDVTDTSEAQLYLNNLEICRMTSGVTPPLGLRITARVVRTGATSAKVFAVIRRSSATSGPSDPVGFSLSLEREIMGVSHTYDWSVVGSVSTRCNAAVGANAVISKEMFVRYHRKL